MPPDPVLIGVPYDGGSSFRRGAAEAPPLIREALASPAGNPYSERLVRVVPGETYEDAGDVAVPGADPRRLIELRFSELARARRQFVALGGDHSITYPIMRGLVSSQLALTVLQIDAHPDLYDEFDGDRYSHACPFARIMEERLCARLVQVGIRAMTTHQREQAQRFGVEQIGMNAWSDGIRPEIIGPWYLSLDLDGLDPAFAPGVSHPEPGGLSVREVLALLESIDAPLVGADIVELNPRQDVSSLTAAVAAKLVKELLGRFAHGRPVEV